MTGFDPLDAKTWPVLLTVQEVAAITRRSVDRIRELCVVGQFQPAPIEGGGKGKRYLWRRHEVERAVFGQTAALRRVS